MPDILYRLGIFLDGVSKPLWTDGHRPPHELRNIVAFQELPMIVGVGTRQFERLAPPPVGIDVCNKRARVVAIISAAAEHHPPSVA